MPKPKAFIKYTLVLVLAIISCNTHALWLNAYGTAADEVRATQFLHMASGGFLVSGQAISNDDAVIYWYGRMDEQGKVLWSKSAKNIELTFDSDGTAHIKANQLVDNANVNILATGKLDSTGNIVNVAVHNNQTVTSNNGKLDLTSVPDVYAGTWKAPNDDVDAVLVKLNANNQVEWSHHYNFSAHDVTPSIYALKQGYLMVLSYYGFNPETLQADWVNVFAKLDSNGNLIAGSTKQLSSNIAFSPTILSDDSIAAVTFGFTGEFLVYKLDQNLNFVWGKRYFSADGKDTFINLSVTEGVDGQLEMHPYRQRYDSDGQLSEEHAVGLVVNANDGSIVSKSEVQVRAFDPYPFTEIALNKYSLTGATSALSKDLSQDQDGFYAMFNNTFQPEWTRLITGKLYDQIELFIKDGNGNYLVGGNTQSWGLGKSDMLFGKLDVKGDIANCGAIQAVNPVLIEPAISVANLASPMAKAIVIDAGAVDVNITEASYSLMLTVSDYPLTATNICAAEDPVIPTVTATPPAKQAAKSAPAAETAKAAPVVVTPTADTTTPVPVVVTPPPSITPETNIVIPEVVVQKTDSPPTVVTISQPISSTASVEPEVVATKPEINVTPPVSNQQTQANGAMDLSVKQMDLGSVLLQKITSQDITINNIGNGALTINTISDLATPFAKTSDECKNKTLAVGTSCKISISFSPTSTGVQSAKLEISSNDSTNATTSLSITGTGEAAKLPPQSQSLPSLSTTDVSIGKQVVINGKDFPKQKGAVMTGAKAAGIMAWSDTAIVFKVPALKAGTYPVKIINKAKRVIHTLQLNVHLPQLVSVTPNIVTGAAKIVLSGQYFGLANKPKAYLVSGKNKRELPVLAGNTETALQIKLPKLKANSYQVLVNNSVGNSIESVSLQIK